MGTINIKEEDKPIDAHNPSVEEINYDRCGYGDENGSCLPRNFRAFLQDPAYFSDVFSQELGSN